MAFSHSSLAMMSLPWIRWLAALSVVFLHAFLFTTGYRLSADDVDLHHIVLQGVGEVVDHTITIASEHGRIGNYAMLPLNAIGAHFSDFPLFRLAAVALHFWAIYLVGAFVSTILEKDLRLFVFLLIVVLHPLDYQHMPPNAYALQNSVPIILVFLARIRLWRLRQSGSEPEILRLLPYYALFCLAMLVNEYAIITGAALLLAEHVALLGRRIGDKGGFAMALARTLGSRRLWMDALAIGATLTVYLAFRVFNASIYEGNTLDGLHRVQETWTTLFMHVASGTTLPRLLELFGEGEWLAIPPAVIRTAWAVGALTFLAFLTASKPKLRLRETVPLILVCVIGAIAVTLPLAASIKFQDWCLIDQNCAYLDSRISVYALGAVLTALLLTMLPAERSGAPRLAASVALSGVLAVVSALTYLTNWHVHRNMEVVVAAWDRASAIACIPQLRSADDRALAGLIEPVQRIPHHPRFSVVDYWRDYVDHRADRLDCDRLSRSVERWKRELGAHFVEAGRVVPLGDIGDGAILANGWSRPEPWGVWSNGATAELKIIPTAPGVQSLGFRFMVYPAPASGRPPQSIGVKINGVDYGDWSLGDEECGARVIRLMEPLPADEEARVSFSIEAPVAPKDITDSSDIRQLGLGLLEMIATLDDDESLQTWAARDC